MQVRKVVETRDIVGESPVWDERSDSLVWVDIVGKRLHRWFAVEDRLETHSAPDFATSIGLREGDGAIVGLRRQIVLWDGDERFEPFAIPEPDVADNRLNEGVVGPDGAFWVGTMQDNLHDNGSARKMDRASGALYRVAAAGSVVRLVEPTIGLSNTCAWLSDGRFITADTLANTLYVYERHGDGLGPRRIFAEPFQRGMPDGSCVDAQDGLWNCRVAGGACIVRYLSDGTLDRVVELPCRSPTACCFGGADLDTLYVTSARFGLDEQPLAEHPNEGAVFAFRPGVRGRPAWRFKG